VVTPSIRGDERVAQKFHRHSLIGLGSVLAHRVWSGTGDGVRACIDFLCHEVGDKAGFNEYDREVMLWAAARSLIKRTVEADMGNAASIEEAAEAWHTMLKLVAEVGKGEVPLVADAHQAVATAFEQARARGLEFAPFPRIASRLPGNFRQLYLCSLAQKTATPRLPFVQPRAC
jgi:hypothetical protein